MDNNNKLQNFYVYITLGLLAASFAAAIYVAVRCYIPYNPNSVLAVSAKRVLWTLLLLPSVVLPLALWLSNMLKPTLSRFSLLSVLLTCCYFVAVPRLYLFGDGSEMSYITSLFAFFLICCTVSVLVRDLKRKALFRCVNVIFGIILTLVFAALSAYIAYFVFKIDFLDRVIMCFVVPMLCGVGMLSSIFDTYSKSTVILNTVCLGYGTLCAALETMNTRVMHVLFVGLCALSFIWQIIDIIKYIFQRRSLKIKIRCNREKTA